MSMDLILGRLALRGSSKEFLEEIIKGAQSMRDLREAWKDLDSPEFFPVKPEKLGEWGRAYEAYRLYQQVTNELILCFEGELERLEPVLLTPSNKDRSAELKRTRLCLEVAEENGLVRMAYRFRGLLEEVHSQAFLDPKLCEKRLRLEDLHHQFKRVIEGVFHLHGRKKDKYRPLLAEARQLKKEYEGVGCSIWGSYCTSLVKILEGRVNG